MMIVRVTHSSDLGLVIVRFTDLLVLGLVIVSLGSGDC